MMALSTGAPFGATLPDRSLELTLLSSPVAALVLSRAAVALVAFWAAVLVEAAKRYPSSERRFPTSCRRSPDALLARGA